jgi:hypothetical protein
VILRWLDDDAPVHLISQRGHDPYVGRHVGKAH